MSSSRTLHPHPLFRPGPAGIPLLRPAPAGVLLTLLTLLSGPATPAQAAPHPRPRAHTPPAESARRAEAKRAFLEGKKRFALRQFRRALAAFSHAYEILPLSGFLFNIGQCHRFLKDCRKAIFFYNGFIRENPHTPDAEFVRTLVQRCQRAEAQIRSRRDRANRLFEQGRRAATLQQYAEAIARFTEAYKTYPRPGYLYHLAEAHRLHGSYTRAVHFYEAYLRQNPGTPRTRAVRGVLGKTRHLAEEAKRRRRARLTARVLPPGGHHTPPPPAAPYYKRWWFWTTIAATVATAVGLGVGLTQNSGATPTRPTVGTWNIGESLR